MHGITRAARRGLRAAIALAIVVMLGALFATPAAADPAPATPAASASGTPEADTPEAGSSLGLGLQLLGVSVKLNVLPLDLTQLVTIDAASSAPASPPPTTPTSVPSPPVTTPVGQPTGSRPAPPSSSTVPNSNANGGNPGGSAPSNPARSTTTVITTPPPATVTKTASPPKARAQGTLRLVRGLLPHTSAMLLIVLIIGTTLAVALMVGFGARRGGRRA